MKLPVYLDYNATAPVDPQVIEAMLPYFNEKFGNPSSKSHWYGLEAAAAVEKARKTIAEFINCAPGEIFFTSGATESINTVHNGIYELYGNTDLHIITSEIEHSAVINSLKKLESKGVKVTYLKVNQYGELDLNSLEREIRPETKVVSLMAANNEIGVLNDITAIGSICKKNNIYFHTDAAQALGKIAIDVQKQNIDFLSFSGHKLYAPKGVGIVYKRKGTPLPPYLLGGGQESGLRSGTLNVPYIAGLGRAMEIAQSNFSTEIERISDLRNKLYNKIVSNLDEIFLNGKIENRLCNNLNICFKHVKSSTLLSELKTVAISSGSACSTDKPEANRVLKAIGLTDEEAFSSVRIGLGRFTTEEEIEYAAETIIQKINYLRMNSPSYMLSKEKYKEKL
jgi:cysteine desulfurase